MYLTTGLSLSSSSPLETMAPCGFETEMLSLKSTLSMEMLERLMSLPETLLPMLLMDDAMELTFDIVLRVLRVLALLTVDSIDSTVFSLRP